MDNLLIWKQNFLSVFSNLSEEFYSLKQIVIIEYISYKRLQSHSPGTL